MAEFFGTIRKDTRRSSKDERFVTQGYSGAEWLFENAAPYLLEKFSIQRIASETMYKDKHSYHKTYSKHIRTNLNKALTDGKGLTIISESKYCDKILNEIVSWLQSYGNFYTCTILAKFTICF